MGQYPNNNIDFENNRICTTCESEVSDESVRTCMHPSKMQQDEVEVCLNCDPDWQKAKGEWIHSSPDFERKEWKLQSNDLDKGDSL